MWHWISFTFLYLSVLVALFIVVGIAYTLLRAPNLKKDFLFVPERWPKVSIIVPVHNEAPKLRPALKSLCQLDYPNYEIILVNDRSSDASAQILQEEAGTCSKLQVVTIHQIPPGWMGKTNALDKGVQKSSGHLLLFTDADVIYEPSVLKRAVALLEKQGLDHLTLTPQLILKNRLMRWYMPFHLFCMIGALNPLSASDTKSSHAIGIGAFNLLRRSVFLKSGGFRNLALNPMEDMALARNVKAYHGKQAFGRAGDLLKVQWYNSFAEIIVSLEKTLLTYFGYNMRWGLSGVSGLLTLIYGPLFALVLCKQTNWYLSLIAVVLILLGIAMVARTIRVIPLVAFLYPISAVMALYMGLNALYLIHKRQGIIRGSRFYSLSDLRDFYKNNH